MAVSLQIGASTPDKVGASLNVKNAVGFYQELPAPPLPPLPTLTTPITASNDGYGPVDLTGTIPAGTYRVYVGPNADTTDPQVYNGIPGSGGFLVTFKTIAPGVTSPTKPIFLPPLPIGGPYVLTLVGDTTIYTDPVVTVVPSQAMSTTSNIRRILPPKYATGPRTIASKKYPQE